MGHPFSNILYPALPQHSAVRNVTMVTKTLQWPSKSYKEHQKSNLTIGSTRQKLKAKTCPTITACACPGKNTLSPPPGCVSPGLWLHKTQLAVKRRLGKREWSFPQWSWEKELRENNLSVYLQTNSDLSLWWWWRWSDTLATFCVRW